jgi:hypothetical protein
MSNCPTQESIEAVFGGEIEFTTTRILTTVGGIERFATYCGGRTKECSYCGHAQKKLNHHCIACGQPYAI